jgi:HAD superfamily hydrolase (TIGR01549 family)
MSAIPPGVKALSFDVWGTLLKGNDAFRLPRLQLLFDLLGLWPQDLGQLYQAYLKADTFYNVEAERTGLDYSLPERLESMYESLGITAEIPSARTVSAIQHEIGRMRLKPEYMSSFTEPTLLATLRMLSRQGYTLGLLSNTGMETDTTVELLLQKLDIRHLFSTALYSCQDGRAKPNPGLFCRMAEELQAERHEVLHIGDNVNADYRATEAGLHAVVYAPNGSPYPHITRLDQLA